MPSREQAMLNRQTHTTSRIFPPMLLDILLTRQREERMRLPSDRLTIAVDDHFGWTRHSRGPGDIGIVQLPVMVRAKHQDISVQVGATLAHRYYVVAFVIPESVVLPKSVCADLAVWTAMTGCSLLHAKIANYARGNLDMTAEVQPDTGTVLDNRLCSSAQVRKKLVLCTGQLFRTAFVRVEQR